MDESNTRPLKLFCVIMKPAGTGGGVFGISKEGKVWFESFEEISAFLDTVDPDEFDLGFICEHIGTAVFKRGISECPQVE